MTYSDAEKAVRDGSYKSLPDDDLRKMMLACMSVSGPNQSAILRIHGFADLIKTELDSREKLSRQNQNSAELLPALQISNKSFHGSESDVQANHWDEAKLTKMIQDRIEESLTVEYKASGAVSRDRTSEIAKDVSSMANSTGGTIFYGIAEFGAPERRHLPERLDPINRLEFTKEWLEHIISQIRPRIPGLKIHPVQLSTDPSHVAYVVEIPAGKTAHQATDCRYYRRYNFESVPMADHEIRDILNRTVHPQVSVRLRFAVYPSTDRAGYAGAICARITNTGLILARYVAICLNVPTRFRGKLLFYDEAIIEEIGEKSSYGLSYSNHNDAPLFPRGSLSPKFKFKVGGRMSPDPAKEIDHIQYNLFADSMPMQEGMLSLDEILYPPPQRHKISR